MQINTKSYRNGEIIFREGDYQRCMYEVEQGSVSIYVNFGAEDEKLLTTLEPGNSFGEIGLANGTARTATAIAAADDTRLAVVDEANFREYFHSNPAKLLSTLEKMSNRLRSLTDDYISVCGAIAEAADCARKGSRRSSGLRARLSSLVQRYRQKPVIGKPDGSFDAAACLDSQEAAPTQLRSFRRDELIFRQGDPADCMYVVRSGRVGIYVAYGTPQEKLLVELGQQSFFGEMGIVNKMPRSASAVSLENDTEAELVSAEAFPGFLQQNPDSALLLMMRLSARIRDLTRDYMDACSAAEKISHNEETNPEDDSLLLRDGLRRFVDDYSQAMQEISTKPELYNITFNHYMHL